jgi:hypothetical protein
LLDAGQVRGDIRFEFHLRYHACWRGIAKEVRN